MRRLLAVWLVGALAAVLVLGACGGGSDGDDADAVDAAAETSGGDDDAADSDDDGSSDDDDNGDDSDDDGADLSDVGVFTAARCVEAVQVFSAAVSAASLAMSGDTKGMESAIEKTEEFAEDAPRDIRDDLEVWTEAYTTYAKGIADSGWNPASGKAPTEEQTKKLEEAGEALQAPDYLAAQDNIDKWLSSDCGNR